MKYTLLNNLGEGNDSLNKYELFINDLPTPKINAKTLELQTSVDKYLLLECKDDVLCFMYLKTHKRLMN